MLRALWFVGVPPFLTVLALAPPRESHSDGRKGTLMPARCWGALSSADQCTPDGVAAGGSPSDPPARKGVGGHWELQTCWA